jgi:hypothetical protein
MKPAFRQNKFSHTAKRSPGIAGLSSTVPLENSTGYDGPASRAVVMIRNSPEFRSELTNEKPERLDTSIKFRIKASGGLGDRSLMVWRRVRRLGFF